VGAEKNQQLTLKNWPNTGVDTDLEPGTELVGRTTFRVFCDSRTCKNSVQWVLETAGENAEGVPCDAWRILILEQFEGQKETFCSKECLIRWLKNYVPPLSPKEKAMIETNNSKVEAKKNIVKVPVPDIPGIEESTYVKVLREQTKERAESAALSQPDGFAEESSNE